MKKRLCIALVTVLALLCVSCSLVEELFSVTDGIVSGGRGTEDGFEIALALAVPETGFEEPLPAMTAQKYRVDTA